MAEEGARVRALDKIVDFVNRDFPMRPLEIGKLKLGGLGEKRPKKGGGFWRMPRKDDHFTVTTLQRTSDGDLVTDVELMRELLAQYGETDPKTNERKLRQIPIRLLSDEIDDVLQAQFCWYGRRACGARSDGEKVVWYYDPTDLKQLNPPRVEDWTDAYSEMRDKDGNKLFKLHSTFNCVIASKESRFGGVYKLRTTSMITFRQLYASLIHIQALTNGILLGMPLMLVVRPMNVRPEIGGEKKETTVYVVHVELRGADLVQLQKLAVEQARYRMEFKGRALEIQQRYRRLLTFDESPEEQAWVQQEFQPDEFEAGAAVEGDADAGEETTMRSASGAPKTASSVADKLSGAGPVGQRQVRPRSHNPPPAKEKKPPLDVEAVFRELDDCEGVEAIRAVVQRCAEGYQGADDRENVEAIRGRAMELEEYYNGGEGETAQQPE
jgi:hypothetical protein